MRRRPHRLARLGIPAAFILALGACLNPRPEDDPFREGDPGAGPPGAAGTPAVQPPGDTNAGEPSNSGAGGSASGGSGGADAPADAGTPNDPDAGVQRDADAGTSCGGAAEPDDSGPG